MLTYLGLIFLITAVACCIRGRSSIFGLLIFSGIFQAGTVAHEISFQPYYFVALFFIFRCMVDALFGVRLNFRCRGLMALLTFCTLGILSAVLYPHIFDGILVYSPKYGLGIENDLRVGNNFGGANKYQACLMMINMVVIFFSATMVVNIKKATKNLNFAFWLLFVTLCAQWLGLVMEWDFPYYLFNNDANYVLANADLSLGLTRPNGTFAEPSMAGPFLTAIFFGALVRYLREGRGHLTLGASMISLALVGSAASYLAIIFCFLFSVFCFILKFLLTDCADIFNKIIQKRFYNLCLGGVLLLAFILLTPSIRDNFATQLTEKISSESFIERSTADIFSFQLLMKSYGIGVGLGSNRSSSLLLTVLSTMGVAGLVFLGVAIVRLFRNPLGSYDWLMYATIGLVINMAFGVPDISYPLLWVFLILLCGAARIEIQFSSFHIPDSTSDAV